jgi:hypothetical protein
MTAVIMGASMGFSIGCERTSPPESPRIPNAATDKPDFIMSVETWIAETKRISGQEFNDKYMGKLVEVTGRVSYYRRPARNEEYYGLASTTQADGEIQFVVIEEAGKKALPGQVVTVSGFVIEHSGRLGSAVILDVTGPPPPTLTLQQLVAGYEANGKLPEHPVIVVGKSFGTSSGKYFFRHVSLTPEGAKPRISCKLDPYPDESVIRGYPDESIYRPATGQTFRFLASHSSVTDEGIHFSGTLLELLD